jgi:hypothetical protein
MRLPLSGSLSHRVRFQTISRRKRGLRSSARIADPSQPLEALGITEPPAAGTRWQIEAAAVVTHSAAEDPDADGDVDCICVELQLTELGVEEADDGPASDKLNDRAATALYRKRKAKKAWRAKIGERAIGGSPAVGEHGSLNREFGA